MQVRPGLWQSIMQPEERDGLEKFEDVEEEEEAIGSSGADAGGSDKAVAVKIEVGSDDSEEDEKDEGDESMEKEKDSDEDDDDDDDDDGEEEEESSKAEKAARGPRKKALGSVMTGKKEQVGGYDMRKREPLYAGADGSAWWELSALAGHMHPSVAAMARTLLSGAPVVYDGNPLQDMALTPFLDKFIQKKAKVKTPSPPSAAAAAAAAAGNLCSDPF